jgi:hypothetical protein
MFKLKLVFSLIAQAFKLSLTNLACSQVFDIDLSSDMLFFWEKSLVIRQGPLLNFAQ